MQLGEKEGRGVFLGSLYKDSAMQGPQTKGLQHSYSCYRILVGNYDWDEDSHFRTSE